jgi:transglutaminase-like putative cysteine protease
VSIHVALRHVTEYQYDRPVVLSPQLVRLRPAPHCRTPILSYSQRIAPETHFINWQQDPQSNYVARLTFPEKVREFRVEIDLVAEMSVQNPFDFFLEPAAEQFPFCYESRQFSELQPFLAREEISPRFAGYLAGIRRDRRRTIDFLVELNQQLSRDISYVIRLDPGVQTKEETLTLGKGSCRDTTWLLVQLLRHLGLAARFVSGYLIQLTPDIKALDGPSGPERDFTDLHAWGEVYLPGAGWIGLDPTSGLFAGEGHLPLACTPEPASAAPISGDVETSQVKMAHTMAVERVYESPRVTRPYSDAQWAHIVALGRTVDADLARHDVRLTMGGEPTFVAVDDRDAPEWNIDALGPTKRLRAADLLWRLKDRFGIHGVVHFGQGKQYPGEQLPRWAFGCYWRADGEPVWRDRSLFADERRPDGHAAADAERFIRALARRLDLTDEHVAAGYEDVWYYLWRERRLPINVDPFDSRLDDELERARLRRVFDRHLDAVVGYALPLKPDAASRPGDGRWRTGPWFLRDERLYLIPGDSPMGYRLPLDALPWVAEDDYPYVYDADPTAPRPPLPPYGAGGRSGTSAMSETVGPAGSFGAYGAPASSRAAPPRLQSAVGGPAIVQPADRERALEMDRAPQPFESASGVVRTSMCAEARGGVLYIFMPPLAALEDYLELVAAVEATASELGTRILIEGYPPPADPRLKQFSVTPDPGVIEVNVQAAACWDDLVSQTTTLYDERTGTTIRRCRICSRVCSSARQARRPEWTRPDTTVCTSSKSRSAACRRPARLPRRRGRLTARCAICSWTSPATPTVQNSASTSSTRPSRRRDAAGCSSYGRSKCRRTRA